MLFSNTDKIGQLVAKHLDAVEKCMLTYYEFMDMYHTLSDAQRIQKAAIVDLLESDADLVRHEIIHEMLEGGLLLESRKYIMTLIEKVDSVADQIEDVARDCVYQMVPLSEIHLNVIREINKVTYEQFKLMKKIVNNIVTKYKYKEMLQDIRMIEEQESQVDQIQNHGIIELFRSAMPLAEKSQVKDTFQSVGNVSDIIEDISDLIEIIMLSRRV